MKLILTAARWRQRDGKDFTIRNSGDEITVDDATGNWLLRSGAAVDLASVAEVEETVADIEQAVDEEPEPESEVDEEPQHESEVDDIPAAEGKTRPLNAANKKLWEEYAASLGVDTKGMNKDEIMAAVG